MASRVLGRGALLFAALGLGCGTTATIHTRSAPPIRGHIIGGTPEAVVISEGPGGPTGIPRREITAIQHPGGVAGAVGGVLLGYGIVNIAVGWESCQYEDEAYCAGVLAPALIGAGMAIFALAASASSKSSTNRTNFTHRHSLLMGAPCAWPTQVLPHGGTAPAPTPSMPQAPSAAETPPVLMPFPDAPPVPATSAAPAAPGIMSEPPDAVAPAPSSRP